MSGGFSEGDFERLEVFLRDHSGMNVGESLRDRTRRAVRLTAARRGCATADQLLDMLGRDDEVLDDLVDEMTVGETYFFRESEQFEAIRRVALPDLLERGGADRAVRMWSAGCATGEEAYSLAIVLAEAGFSARAFVLGTDLSRSKLARARAARYRAWSLRGPGALAARPHLVPDGERFRVDAPIRRLVSFRHLNLVTDEYPSLETGTWSMDVILCRNVLIYFDHATAARVAARLFEALAPGGWLFTAGSDPILTEFAPFTHVAGDFGPAYRRPSGADAPAPPRSAPAPRPARCAHPHASRPRRPASGPPALAPLEAAAEARAHGEYDRALDLLSHTEDSPEASALRVRTLANRDGSAVAEAAAREAVHRHPLAVELRYLHGSLLVDLGRDVEAADAFRRALFLDRTLGVAHFALATVLLRLGDAAGARRAFRNALEACRGLVPEQLLPLGDGERVANLEEAARAGLAALDDRGSTP